MGATIDDLVTGLGAVFEGNSVLVAASLETSTECDQARTLALLSIAVSLKRLADASGSAAPVVEAPGRVVS